MKKCTFLLKHVSYFVFSTDMFVYLFRDNVNKIDYGCFFNSYIFMLVYL